MVKKLTYLLLFFIPAISYSQVTYNFESGSLAGWLQVPDAHWSASTSTPLSGSYSLKHTFNNTTSATDRISIPLPSWNPNAGRITWQLKVRHGYDPSSSNRWWIYLMANQDANQMQTGGTCSGYAIGVNLIGSDDLLKLYRIDNGIPQVLIASTLNWETQIGKTVAGAIEVDRTANGIFTLKASITGSFSSLTNYGNFTDMSFFDFNYFGICYNYTASADQLLWVDDISFNFIPLNGNDLTSEVVSPTSQISAGAISSTINTFSAAFDVLKFRIKDNSTLDNLPTRVKNITLKKATSISAADWLKTIGGVRIRGESGDVTILNQTIGADKIDLIVDSTTISIPNGQTKEFTLSIYLKPDSLVDGSSLKMMIDSTHHGFAAGLSGSDFSNTFTSKVISNEFRIDVAASTLKFSQLPVSISKNTSFSLSVGGADNAGNIDKDFNNPITLSLSLGGGSLTSASGLTKTSVLGISAWNDLMYNTLGTLRVLASSSGVSQAQSEMIKVLCDSTSVILPVVNQPEGVGISSLKTFPAQAVEVLKFRIQDQGETDDLPTIVRNIKISRTEITNIASLSKVIGGVLLKVNGNFIGISDIDIKTSYFTFSVGNNNLVVANGGFVDASILIYLKDGGLIDNQKLQLKIDSTNHGFTTYTSGSKFNSTFSQKVISNVFAVGVTATQLKFTAIPSRVGVLLPFAITLNATDLNGNVDQDFSGSANLSQHTGIGNLSIPLGSILPFVLGSCTFDSMTYSKPDRFSLQASCLTFNNIESPLITCGDSDGGIAALATSADSVLINSISTSSQNAVEVMRLNVFDAGTSDGLPLIPTKISLHCFDPTKAEQLNRQIAGFVVKADSKIIDVESYSLNNGVFEINIKDGNLSITNGDTITLSISIYLKRGEAIDNFSFRFYVPDSNHNWESSSDGTGFVSGFNSSVYGPTCIIKVDATNLMFVNTPFSTSPSTHFILNVVSTDVFGSIDVDYKDQLTLSLENDTDVFSGSDNHQNLISGRAKWSDVKLNGTGTYRFKVMGAKLGYSISDEIYCGLDNDCLIQEDFEKTINPSWVGVDDWIYGTISPINSSKSLQHKQSINSGVSKLSIPVTFPDFGDKLIEWNFTLRNGDWDPSTDNYFVFALMADSPDITSQKTNGFFVGIDPSSGNDFLTLWRSSQGVKTSIISTNFDWNPNEEVKVRVGLTPKGEWKLWYMPKYEQSFIFGGKGTCLSNISMGWSGLGFIYSASRSGQLYMDDLSICVSDYSPVLQWAKPLNLNTVRVQFSEKINIADASTKTNYSITDNVGHTINVNDVFTSADLPNGINLKTDQLPFGRLLLKVDGVGGLNGSSIKDSIYFGLGERGTFGRLVINEIMANPDSTIGLAGYEYIELYNPTNDTILMSGWKIQLNNYSSALPNDSILPNQYAVLCSTSAVPKLKTIGKTIGVTNFPSLLNAGMMIKLFDSGGVLISLVNYSDSWYGDEQKKAGGWSLEKIDFHNLMEGKSNWRASLSPNGGTPCAVNSVTAVNQDITPPHVLSFEVLSDRTLSLHFSEPMDSLMATFTNNYDIDNGIGHPASVSLVGNDYSEVLISLSEAISSSIIYKLFLNQSITDFSGNQLVNDGIPFSLPQNPVWNDIVINEVLFNPNAGGEDFIEIYNRSDKTVDLSKMLLSSRNSLTNKLDQIYSVSDTARLLFPSDYAVITVNPELIKQFYYSDNAKAFVKVSNIASFNSDEGHVVLMNKDSVVVDELHYREKMHSKLLNDFKGVSLERINPDFESSSTSTWHSAAQTVGFATPTYKNSQWIEPYAKEDAFVLSPKTFSPDGDGRDDYLLITYKLPSDGCIANIKVYNAEGTEMKRLASNLLIGTQGTLTWDGLDNKNQRVPIGIYIVYIEYFSPKGEVNKYKKTCVVAEKL